MVDLVAEDDEGNFGELLHGQKGVELSLGLREALVVLCVDEEDDSVNLGGVVAPDTAGCGKLVWVGTGKAWERTLLVTAEIEGGETDIANGEFLGGWRRQSSLQSYCMSGQRTH